MPNLTQAEDTVKKQLLERIASAAGMALCSPFDWESHLNEVGGAEDFLNQLSLEWLPAEAPNAFCETMALLVQKRMSQADENWPQVWAHTLRVIGVALTLAPEAGLDRTSAYLLALFHDAAKLDEEKTGIPHELGGALLARKTLQDDMPPLLLDRLCNAIAKTGKADDPFVRILHDADKLDKIGAAGIIRRLTTPWGAKHKSLALQQVASDTARFPRMGFFPSQTLAEHKRAFCQNFLANKIRKG
jgi:HD domain